MNALMSLLMAILGMILMVFHVSRMEPSEPGWKSVLKLIWALCLVVVPLVSACYLTRAAKPGFYAASNCLTAKAYTRAVKSYYGISGNVEMAVLEHYRYGTLYWEVW